jgi:hypothetical protein
MIRYKSMERTVKSLLAAVMCVGAAGTAQAGILCVLGLCGGPPGPGPGPHVAPAPDIGSGVPVVLAIGGVLLATRLFTRWRRS